MRDLGRSSICSSLNNELHCKSRWVSVDGRPLRSLMRSFSTITSKVRFGGKLFSEVIMVFLDKLRWMSDLGNCSKCTLVHDCSSGKLSRVSLSGNINPQGRLNLDIPGMSSVFRLEGSMPPNEISLNMACGFPPEMMSISSFLNCRAKAKLMLLKFQVQLSNLYRNKVTPQASCKMYISRRLPLWIIFLT